MVSNGMDFYKGQNSKLIENEFRSCSNCIQKISGHKNPISENQSITTFIQHSKNAGHGGNEAGIGKGCFVLLKQ